MRPSCESNTCFLSPLPSKSAEFAQTTVLAMPQSAGQQAARSSSRYAEYIPMWSDKHSAIWKNRPKIFNLGTLPSIRQDASDRMRVLQSVPRFPVYVLVAHETSAAPTRIPTNSSSRWSPAVVGGVEIVNATRRGRMASESPRPLGVKPMPCRTAGRNESPPVANATA